jgi:hypothetical protein
VKFFKLNADDMTKWPPGRDEYTATLARAKVKEAIARMIDWWGRESLAEYQGIAGSIIRRIGPMGSHRREAIEWYIAACMDTVPEVEGTVTNLEYQVRQTHHKPSSNCKWTGLSISPNSATTRHASNSSGLSHGLREQVRAKASLHPSSKAVARFSEPKEAAYENSLVCCPALPLAGHTA